MAAHFTTPTAAQTRARLDSLLQGVHEVMVNGACRKFSEGQMLWSIAKLMVDQEAWHNDRNGSRAKCCAHHGRYPFGLPAHAVKLATDLVGPTE